MAEILVLVDHVDGVVRKVIDVSPTPKAVAYGAMSLVGIAVWELYCSLVHRKALRARGVIPAARPRFGVARWFRYTRITWVAWSLSIKHGHVTSEQAWTAALREIARRARVKAEKKNAGSGRTPIRVTAVMSHGPTVRRVGPTQWTRPPIVWLPGASSARQLAPTSDSRSDRSGANSASPPGARTGRQETAALAPEPAASSDPVLAPEESPEPAPQPRRSGARKRAKTTRRSMDEWVDLAGPVFHTELQRLRRRPTGTEFAAAIRAAGLGTASASTAKNIRTEILDRAELPQLD